MGFKGAGGTDGGAEQVAGAEDEVGRVGEREERVRLSTRLLNELLADKDAYRSGVQVSRVQ